MNIFAVQLNIAWEDKPANFHKVRQLLGQAQPPKGSVVGFPELFRRVAAERRPELFVVIASWPDKRIVHWVRLLQARAIENQAYVVGVNRVGRDPFYSYSGRSLIVDYNGEILADAGQTEG